MGQSKSPVDELVDGIDAIGAILDDNLPRLNSQIEEMGKRQLDQEQQVTDMRGLLKELHEMHNAVEKTVTTLDIRIEELLAAVGTLAFRLDQIQKMVLELSDKASVGSGDTELVDTVKMLEDRLKRLEARRTTGLQGKIGFD